jgi:hypothetical protein
VIVAALGFALRALADPSTDLLEAREQVERAAAAVATARAEGANRSELAELMAAYRDAAARHEQLALAQGPTPDAIRRERQQALTDVTRALAEGATDVPARAVLASWLGDPAARAAVLRSAADSTTAMPADIRRGVLLDVLEQTDALAALLSFDAAVLAIESDQAELRALSLRRRGPGQTASIEDEVRAVRLEEDARRAEERAASLLLLRAEVWVVREKAVAALGEER